jgi:hypothetical protein
MEVPHFGVQSRETREPNSWACAASRRYVRGWLNARFGSVTTSLRLNSRLGEIVPTSKVRRGGEKEADTDATTKKTD